MMSSMSFSVQEGGIQDYQSDPYDMSTYVNPNDTYVPSSEVEQGTDISSGDFQKNQDYYIDGATTPIALFCLGFVALVVLNCCLCCGISKVCASASEKHAVSCGQQFFGFIFFVFFIICFIASHMLYLGYGDASDGLEIMRGSVEELGGGFDEMDDVSKLLSVHGDVVKDKCTAYGSCLDAAETVVDGVGYMQDDIQDIPDYVDDITAYIDMIEQFLLLCMFLMYGLLLITMVLYLLTQLCCKPKMGGAICCGNIAFFMVSLIGILWMVITSITADFCYENPTINTLNLMQANKGQMYLVWYSSCHSGENPINRYINHTHIGNEDIISAIGADNSAAARSILAETTAISQLLGNMTRSTLESCSPVQSGWLSLLNEGVCDSFFLGVRMIWICEVWACISLFFLMITGAIMGKNAKNHEKQIAAEPLPAENLDDVSCNKEDEMDMEMQKQPHNDDCDDAHVLMD